MSRHLTAPVASNQMVRLHVLWYSKRSLLLEILYKMVNEILPAYLKLTIWFAESSSRHQESYNLQWEALIYCSNLSEGSFDSILSPTPVQEATQEWIVFQITEIFIRKVRPIRSSDDI